jgi:hypothetical protein
MMAMALQILNNEEIDFIEDDFFNTPKTRTAATLCSEYDSMGVDSLNSTLDGKLAQKTNQKVKVSSSVKFSFSMNHINTHETYIREGLYEFPEFKSLIEISREEFVRLRYPDVEVNLKAENVQRHKRSLSTPLILEQRKNKLSVSISTVQLPELHVIDVEFEEEEEEQCSNDEQDCISHEDEDQVASMPQS